LSVHRFEPVTRGLGVAIPLTWLLLHRNTLSWLVNAFSGATSENLALFLIVVAALAVGLGKRRSPTSGSAVPREANALPILMTAGACLVELSVRPYFAFPQLSVALFGIGTYGVIEPLLPATLWRRGLPAALLFSCALPFGAGYGTGLGFPARALSASVAGDLLAVLGAGAVSAQDVLVLENGLAHVDLPCAGLKSLWAGTLFFLAATWVGRRRLSTHWWGLLLALWGFLFAANVLRISLLVLIGLVADLPEVAEILHRPLGVIGFLMCCGLAGLLLYFMPRESLAGLQRAPVLRGSSIASVMLWVGLVVLSVLSPPLRASEEAVRSTFDLTLPPSIESAPLSLTSAETSFYAIHPRTVARKWRIRYGGSEGSLLIVYGESWRAHHAPELCLAAHGYKVTSLKSVDLSANLSLNAVDIDGGEHSAFYWFQSRLGTTSSLLERFQRDIVSRDKHWVLVSVLLDSSVQIDEPGPRRLLELLHECLKLTMTSVSEEEEKS